MPCFVPLVHRMDRWTVATKAEARATDVGRAESSDLEGNVHMVPGSKVDEASLARDDGSLDDGLPRASVEYRVEGRSVIQEISIGDLKSIATRPAPAGMRKAPADAWWRSYLAGKAPEPLEHRGRINYVDLFCASGGLSTGFEEAAMAFGLEAQSLMGVDMDARALQVYEQNHRPMATSTTSVDALVDFPLDETLQQQRLVGSPTILDPDLRYLTGKVDVVLAGPPCQGHSAGRSFCPAELCQPTLVAPVATPYTRAPRHLLRPGRRRASRQPLGVRRRSWLHVLLPLWCTRQPQVAPLTRPLPLA